jgi:glycosyltransferase involved in cell wall biosynthesis
MKKPANIAVEATVWNNQRGYGRHARALFSRLIQIDLENHYTFLVDTLDYKDLPEGINVHNVHASIPAIYAASAKSNRSVPDLIRMGHALSAHKYDLILFPTIYSYVPVLTRAKKIVFIHDVIPEFFPQYTLPTPSAKLLWKVKAFFGRKQADALVTVSEYSRRKLIQHFHLNPEHIFVVEEASDHVFRPLGEPVLSSNLRNLGIPETGRMVIYVGGFGPHKNISRLIQSFHSLATCQSFEDISLILVGQKHQEAFFSEIGLLERLVDEKGLKNRVLFTGFIPDEELTILLNRAGVLVLPSLMEGFGLPAIEAAACGCPVIATRESPLPDLLGDAAIYIDPFQTDELTCALENVLSSTELRQTMQIKGVRVAARFTWESAALQLKSIINKVFSASSD